MRRVLSISEVVETLAAPGGAVEVLATGDAEYDEGTAQLVMRLDSVLRPVDANNNGHGLPEGLLPHSDKLLTHLDWTEALPAARDIFRDWARRVHQSVSHSRNL
jgi:hypothetical protein